MNETQKLIGALSNDLFRIATLTHRGSEKAAVRFLQESKRWSVPLQTLPVAPYIKNIAKTVSNTKKEITLETAERFLMYGILLQNYSLHNFNNVSSESKPTLAKNQNFL